MKRFLLLLCILCTLSVSAQITITPKYQPTDYSALTKALDDYWDRYNDFEKEIERVSNHIVNLLSQNIDEQMREFLNTKHKETSNVAIELSQHGLTSAVKNKLSTIKRDIQTEIINYNNRVAIHNAEVERRRQEEERLAREEAERIAKEEAERNANWSGTGFALRNKYIVTNYHVIEEARTIKILGINSDFRKEYSAKVCATDRSNDLALLEIVDDSFAGFGVVPYYAKTQMAEVGESVFVLGYPLTSTMGEEIKLTTGVISSRTGFQGDVSSYQFSAPIQPGNSGAPLFDNKGNLIGIVSAKHTGAENAGYAIKTSYLKQLTDCVATSGILPYNSHAANVPLTDKVKKIRNFVFIIKCSKNGQEYNYAKTEHNSKVQINREILYPHIRTKCSDGCTIDKIILSDTFTAIEITYNNGQSWSWCKIDRDTYISLGGDNYKLTRAEGIKYSPEKTYFSYSIKFTLYFPPIPKLSTSFSLIEPGDSSWKFYGIELK